MLIFPFTSWAPLLCRVCCSQCQQDVVLLRKKALMGTTMSLCNGVRTLTILSHTFLQNLISSRLQLLWGKTTSKGIFLGGGGELLVYTESNKSQTF